MPSTYAPATQTDRRSRAANRRPPGRLGQHAPTRDLAARLAPWTHTHPPVSPIRPKNQNMT